MDFRFGIGLKAFLWPPGALLSSELQLWVLILLNTVEQAITTSVSQMAPLQKQLMNIKIKS